IPNQLLFLGINRDHGLSPLLKLSTLLAQILKLRIAVWMLFGPLFGLLQPLQAVLQIFPQNLANHGRARLISCCCSSALILIKLFDVHFSGVIGSPRVAGSTMASIAFTKPGCRSADFLRPPPGRR